MRISDWSSDVCSSDLQSLLQLMPMEADREAFWRRVTLGYRLNDLGQGSRTIIESFDLYREVLEMLERKRPFGQHMHSDYCKFEGKTVNQWLAPPGQRSEARRVGKEGVRRGRSR